MGYYYKRLKELRVDNDYTQSYIAEYLGIRQEYYSKYELGKIEIPAHMIKELAKLYKTTTDYILEMSDSERNNYIKYQTNINGNKNIGKITIK